MSTDPASLLSPIRERSAAALEFPASGFAEDSIRACTQSAMDVPRLLAAVEAALSRHVPDVIDMADGQFRYCSTCSSHPAWPCPEVAAITAALAGLDEWV